MKKNKIEILVNVLLWLLLFINWLNYTLVEDDPINAIVYAMIVMVIIAVPFYFNYFFLAHLIFKEKKYFLYIIIVTALIISTYFILNLTSSTWLLDDEDTFSEAVSIITNLIIIIGLSNLIKGILSWVYVQQKKSDLEKEKLQSELNFLKLQINPHFLFNSLNNIYSLSYNKSDEAAPMIARLSKILRYMLYDCQDSKVLLSKEIELLKNFIDLNQLKIGADRNIDFYTEGIENRHKIAPLILITFLENAFKHGNVLFDKNGWVKVECIVENDTLTYKVSNSTTQNSTKTVDSGIGLKNINKQLELNYDSKFELDISESEKEYFVKLCIELN